MIKGGKKEEKTNMCKALEDLWEDGVKTGEERGISLGIQKAVLLLRKVGMKDDMIVDMIKTEYNVTGEEVKRLML